MSGLFSINAINKLDSIVDWSQISAICDSHLVNSIVRASSLLIFASILLVIIKRLFTGQGLELLSIAKEMYLKIIVLATITMNPFVYRSFAKMYVSVLNGLYEKMFKQGITSVQWSIANLAQKINETTSMGILDVFNPVAWTTNILGCLVSLTINLAMIFYWLLASIAPIYTALIILIIPIMMAFWPIFDGMGRKVVMLIISGIMLMFMVGLTMTLLGTELNYYAVSEMIQEGNMLVLIILAVLIITTIIAMPMIMTYLFDNGILNVVQVVFSIVSMLTMVSLPVSIKMQIMQWIKKKAFAFK